MRANINQEIISGRIYDQNLAIKTVQNQKSENYGKEFIQGSIDVATDEAGLNVLTVHYTYITEFTKNNKQDSRFINLKKIMNEDKTWLKVGKDEATKVKLTPAAALNDFYPQGGDQLVSSPRNEGGFINIVNELEPEGINRQKFTFDAVITGVTLVEANPETNTEEYAKINAAIFNFRNAILPFPLIAKSKAAINYFMGLEASPTEPVYTQVWGEIVSTTVKVEKVVESAFGEPSVDISERSRKEWVVTGAKPEPYIFNDESTITIKDIEKALADRNIYLEEVKARAKEYYENRGGELPFTGASTSAPTPNTTIPAGGFNF